MEIWRVQAQYAHVVLVVDELKEVPSLRLHSLKQLLNEHRKN
jgi:hypothetical protein